MPYIPNKEWKTGDRILPNDLNHIEDGIKAASEAAEHRELPSSGLVGQVLVKTENGVEWRDIDFTLYWVRDDIPTVPTWNSDVVVAALWNDATSAILDWITL